MNKYGVNAMCHMHEYMSDVRVRQSPHLCKPFQISLLTQEALASVCAHAAAHREDAAAETMRLYQSIQAFVSMQCFG